jgi:hypothetical protein
VKEVPGNGTYPWWLRSPFASYSTYFVRVGTGGTVSYGSAYYSYGFAPGFDL